MNFKSIHSLMKALHGAHFALLVWSNPSSMFTFLGKLYLRQWWGVVLKRDLSISSENAFHLWAQKKGDVGKLCTTENAPWETTILSTNLLREKMRRKYIITPTLTNLLNASSNNTYTQ